jgi:hypothetical protein
MSSNNLTKTYRKLYQNDIAIATKQQSNNGKKYMIPQDFPCYIYHHLTHHQFQFRNILSAFIRKPAAHPLSPQASVNTYWWQRSDARS